MFPSNTSKQTFLTGDVDLSLFKCLSLPFKCFCADTKLQHTTVCYGAICVCCS